MLSLSWVPFQKGYSTILLPSHFYYSSPNFLNLDFDNFNISMSEDISNCVILWQDIFSCESYLFYIDNVVCLRALFIYYILGSAMKEKNQKRLKRKLRNQSNQSMKMTTRSLELLMWTRKNLNKKYKFCWQRETKKIMQMVKWLKRSVCQSNLNS